MSGSPFGILEYESANNQVDAMSDASQLQYDAYMQGINAMMHMWQQAQHDFAPYLSAGSQGLLNLQTSLPQYMNDVVMPAAQQYSSYMNTALPGANWSVNPVTGEFNQGSTQLGSSQAPVNIAQWSPSPYQGVEYPEVTPWEPPGSQSNGQGADIAPAPPTQTQQQPNTQDPNTWPGTNNAGRNGFDLTGVDLNAVPHTRGQTGYPIEFSGSGLEGRAFSPRQSPQGMTRAINKNQMPQAPGIAPGNNRGMPAQNMGAVATPEQLQQGGVFSPAIPEFQRSLSDFQFNENDPVYQQKRKAKEKEINNFLAKRGLQGSSSGLEFMQKEMDKLRAEDESRQYSRARTERDYMTQTDIDKYRLGEQRGSTLYGRTMGQQSDMYNRMVQSAMMGDQRAIDQLQRQYGTAQNMYGLLYGAGLDLTKSGAGASSSAGAGSITTGQNVSGQYGLAGQAQAQGALGQSAVWGNYMAGMGQNMGNTAGAIWQNWGNNSGGGGGSGGGYGYYGGGGGNYGIGGTGGYGPGGSDNWENYL